eukprot:2001071-Prymnesium_polylepis.1
MRGVALRGVQPPERQHTATGRDCGAATLRGKPRQDAQPQDVGKKSGNACCSLQCYPGSICGCPIWDLLCVSAPV